MKEINKQWKEVKYLGESNKIINTIINDLYFNTMNMRIIIDNNQQLKKGDTCRAYNSSGKLLLVILDRYKCTPYRIFLDREIHIKDTDTVWLKAQGNIYSKTIKKDILSLNNPSVLVISEIRKFETISFYVTEMNNGMIETVMDTIHKPSELEIEQIMETRIQNIKYTTNKVKDVYTTLLYGIK